MSSLIFAYTLAHAISAESRHGVHAYIDDLHPLGVIQVQSSILDDGFTECRRLLRVAVIHFRHWHADIWLCNEVKDKQCKGNVPQHKAAHADNAAHQ